MPLLKKQVYAPRKNPAEVADPKATVFMYEPTGEVFASYDDYLLALNDFQSPLWTCKLTGRTNLTFREAMQSEHDATESVDAMPHSLKKFVAERANFSVQAISTIVDGVVDDLKARFLPGELVVLEGDGGKKHSCQVASLLDNDSYMVDILHGDSVVGTARVVALQLSLLSRPKNALSKILIKKFLRAILYRRTALLPWQIKAEVAEQLALSMEPPAEAAALLAKDANSRMRSSPSKRSHGGLGGANRRAVNLESPPAGPKYPIDDDLLMPEDVVDESAFPPSTSFTSEPEYFVPALTVWSFWTTFAKSIKCTPLHWDDWLASLQHRERKNPPLEELFVSLLIPISKFRRASSRSAYYEWLSPIVPLMFPEEDPFKLHASSGTASPPDSDDLIISGAEDNAEDDVADDEDSEVAAARALIDVDQLAHFITSKLKWNDDNWTSMLGGLLCDCALLTPHNAFLAAFAKRIQQQSRDLSGLFLLDLDVALKLNLLSILTKVHLLKFDACKAFVEETLASQDELTAQLKGIEGELSTLRTELAAQDEEIEMARSQDDLDMKAIRKLETHARSLRQQEGKLQKKLDKTTDALVKIRRLHSQPLGEDHRGRQYWYLPECGFADVANLYVTKLPVVSDASAMDLDNQLGMDHSWYRIDRKAALEQIVHGYLNDKGVRERVLKGRLEPLLTSVAFVDTSMELDIEDDGEVDGAGEEDDESRHTESDATATENEGAAGRKRRQSRLAKLSLTQQQQQKRAKPVVPRFMRYKNDF